MNTFCRKLRHAGWMFLWLGVAMAMGAPITVGPGGSFDHETIQAAIGAASAGDTILVAAGDYDDGPIALNKAVTLLGPNAGLAGDDAGRGAEARIVNSKITVTAAAVIDGFEIYQTNDTADAVLIQAAATLRNSQVRRDGVNTGVTARGVTTAVGTSGYTIESNLFTGDPSGGFFGGHTTWNSGLYLNGGSGAITDNVFENCRTAINADDFNAGIEIAGNTFRTSGTYLSFGGTVPTDGQFTIAGNEFFLDWIDPVTNWLPSSLFNLSNVAATFRLNVIDNTFGGVASGDLSDEQKFGIEARNWHRGRSGRNGVVDFVENEQVVVLGNTTILSAVNAAAAGDTVLVSPGTSNESISINKALTLKGANHGIPAADGSGIAPGGRGDETIMTRGGPVVFNPTADDVIIDGFTFTGGGGRLIDSYANTDNLQILNCVFDIPSGAASGGVIQLDSGSRNGLVIKNNRFAGVGTSSWLYLGGPNNADQVIEGNDFVGTGSRAIFGAGSGFANILIKGNYVGSGIVTGFNMGQLETPVIEENTFVGVQYAAMQIGSFNGGYIRNNMLDGTGSGFYFGPPNDFTLAYGIMLFGGAWGTQASEGITIEGNTVVNYLNPSPSPGDSFAAIYLSPDAGPDIQILGNTLENNSTAIRINSDQTGIVVAENSMSGNEVSLWNQKNADVNASFNYWGSDEPDFALLVNGDNVDVSIWYTDAALTMLASSLPVENVTQNTFFATIQAALNEANAGDTIALAAGTHTVANGLNVPVSVTIVGAGEDETLVQVSRSSASYGVQTATDVTLELTMRDLTIEAVDNVRFFFFHIAHNKSFTLEDVTVIGMGQNYYHTGIETWGNTVGGVDVINVEEATLRNVTVREASRNAISLSAVRDIVMENITVEDSGAREGSAAVAIYNRNDYPANNTQSIDWDGGLITGAPIGVNLDGGALGAIAGDDIRNVVFADNAVQAVASADEAEALLAHNSFDRAVVVRDGDIKVPVIFSSIPAAIASAVAGDVVEVASGNYEGPVLIGQDNLTLRAAASAATQPVVSVSGATSALGTVQLLPGTDGVTIEGLEIIGIDGPAGLEKGAVYLQGNQSNVTLRGNTITAAGDAAIQTEWGATIDGLLIEGNVINGMTFNPPGTGGPAGDQFSTPNWPRSLVYVGGPSNGANKLNIVFKDNIVDGVSGDANNSNVLINLDGADVEISGNLFGGGNGARPNVPLVRARGTDTIVSENVFAGASAIALWIGNGAGNLVTENNFVGGNPVALVNVGVDLLDANANHWDAENPDFSTLVIGNVDVTSWYVDAARTILVTLANFEDVYVGPEDTVSFQDLYIGAGATWTVYGALDVTGTLTIANGGTLEVIDGTLILGTVGGGAHVMAGTFTIYNSFGSMVILTDTEFSGDALMLISDIHVADAVTLTVSGTLLLDGCRIDSLDDGGRFAIEVVPGGELVMKRNEISDADILLGGDGSLVRDNLLSGVAVLVAAGAEDNQVFHNVLLNGSSVTDDGTGTILVVDGWSNVASLADTLNNLTANLTDTGLPADRTLDAEGNLFVQPGDIVRVAVDVDALQEKISGVEAMLGFNTEFFTVGAPSSLSGVDPWIYELHNVFSQDGVYGKVDANVGLRFNYDSPEGTTDDLQVADIALGSLTDVEGVTRVYFRTRMANDNPFMRTRLSGYDGVNDIVLTPFTMNTGIITVDGTAPEIADFTATQVQEGVPVDVFDNVFTVQGTVVFTVDLFDALAGIEDQAVVLTLTNQDDPSITATLPLDSTATIEVNGEDWTRYTFVLTVDSATPNGTYLVEVDGMDRSGNLSATLTGILQIDVNQIVVTVQLEGAVTGPFNRIVTFLATDAAQQVIGTWVREIEFTGGFGTDTLLLVPADTVRLSAKTQYHLRRRVDVTLDVNGEPIAEFIGANMLLGGDLNGDNVVTMTDFNRLRFHWFTANDVADITGNGATTQADFDILRGNWFTEGDPE